jgi:putative Mg2+ transporter-C (MgtC) family protein
MLINDWELYIRLVVALIFGAAIGFERATKNKDAGLRTHALVCLGSALVMVLSVTNEGQFRDPMRLAAQVVSGIGFIGAGVIWMDKNNVKRGLTTAANLWATASLGLAIGYGVYDIAVVTFVLMLIAVNLPFILRKMGVKMHDTNIDDQDDNEYEEKQKEKNV